MTSYIFRRLLLIIPTLIGIMTINFFIVQTSPGGPVERMLLKIEGQKDTTLGRITGDNQSDVMDTTSVNDEKSIYKGSNGLSPELVEDIKKLYGFDKPILERYLLMMKNYITFDFGESFFKNATVIELIKEKLPVSISLGLWSTLIIYFISIPLGIKKALNHGTKFDVYSSTVIIIGSAIPGFLFAILLVILFAGGNYFDIFPLRGLFSDNFDELSLWQQIKDYFWHLTLPITAMVIGGFATLTMLTKNSFLDEISKQYVVTARAKGLEENKILYKHIFRNAMLIIISGFPAAFIGMFFTGSLLIEVIFSLDGIGLLGFEATLYRDYPVMFATLYIFTLMGLVISLVSDILYTWVDPRINFERV
ncbi:microcin C ABC transporter permease YejB [Arcobacter sp. CECT 8985]|uniref:microcin C ABC transporter permease YejB n=1 Tax=Arcobacter sp. CECT 8985 TaxID=1935424 RepID=UPI00100BF430|nr:microcin C ABC transporter permease YejB [Arcobacter sp. CECT 8985]RXJ86846.1 microcin ABC transporter permease [Arcobacter sp. CECT 8985]